MKKIVIGLMVATLIVTLSLSVMAIEPVSQNLGDEHYAWELTEAGTWRGMGKGVLTANARAWSRFPKQGSCNKKKWVIPVTVQASVAQWIEFHLSGTRYIWRVRKPGTYAANSLEATLKSNGDVTINFAGFANLYSGDSVNKEINTWYAYGEPTGGVYDPTLTWIEAGDLNTTTVPDSGDLHDGMTWKLWNKIEVVECNSACEYENNATITLVLQNQKMWINPKTGNFFKRLVAFPAPIEY